MKFNAVYVEREKSQCLLHYNNMKYTLSRTKKENIMKNIFVYRFLFHICSFVAANLL